MRFRRENMESPLSLVEWIFLIPVLTGAVYGFLCLLAFRRFRTRDRISPPLVSYPPVTILKPVYGLEKNQRTNLRSACLQDYPEYQVVFSVHGADDPALPLLREIQEEFRARAAVVVSGQGAGPNGKVNNLLGALSQARHDILVISDSDVRLEPGYLKAIVAPLADPRVAFVCTLYRATAAERWFEKMELLTLNADFIPSVIFAYVTQASSFCLGSSVAFRKSSLGEIGGMAPLADYLAEDYELGRRLLASGKKMVLAPHVVDVVVDLQNLTQWWNHQVSWDQKTRAARPGGFFATLLIRSIPFALLLAAWRLGDPFGLAVLAGALGVRVATAGAAMRWGLGDRAGWKSLALLPLRDLVALVTWALAFTKKTVLWRGLKLTLSSGGRLVRQEPSP